MLKGTLDDFTLPDIFRLLSMAQRTGTLDIARSAGTGRVFFRDGHVYFAESSLTREPLGQKLIRARSVTEGQLMKALDEHAATGGRVGEILVAAGALTLEQLEVAVKEQIEDSVFDLLRWELGEFEWAPGEEVEVEVPITVSVENLIMEASRRLDELAVIKRKIPSVDSVLRMAPKPPEGAVEINITPEEWRILVLVDGTRDVAAIAEAVALDEFGAMRVLYGLVAAGLIELAPGNALPAEEVADVEPETEVVEAEADVDAEIEPEVVPAFAALEDEIEEIEEIEVTPVAVEEPPLPLAVDLSPTSNGRSAPPVESEIDDAEPAFLDDSRAFSIETFDAPTEDELTTEFAPPEPEAAAPEAEAVAPEPEPVALDTQPEPAEAELEEPTIDRAAVVRELAGLFGDDDRPRAQRTAIGESTRQPQRLEDDDQITKGLISRLIDGVKGL
jgi:CBS domain-containing protein